MRKMTKTLADVNAGDVFCRDCGKRLWTLPALGGRCYPCEFDHREEVRRIREEGRANS